MAGYLPPSGSNYSGLSYDAMLYCKTNIGGYFFDGFMNVQHSKSLTITSNPVETGASVVDHAYVNPARIVMNIKVSDVNRSMVPGQFEERTFRHTSAWAVLNQIQANRIPVDVFTKLGLYKNMLIEDISANDDANTFRSLDAQVTLVEIPVARVKTVKITSADQTTIETMMAQVEAENADESLLSQLFSLFGYS